MAERRAKGEPLRAVDVKRLPPGQGGRDRPGVAHEQVGVDLAKRLVPVLGLVRGQPPRVAQRCRRIGSPKRASSA
eukprot:230140-Pyramimonas_sp.AAC.1